MRIAKLETECKQRRDHVLNVERDAQDYRQALDALRAKCNQGLILEKKYRGGWL